MLIFSKGNMHMTQNKQYPIIIGADAGELPFAVPSIIAHARVGGRYFYCEHDAGRGTNILHYERSYAVLEALKPEDQVLARRIYIDFDDMPDCEIEARWFAKELIDSNTIGHAMARLESVDREAETAVWYLSARGETPVVETRTMVLKEGATSCINDNDMINALCDQYRINLFCDGDLGAEKLWTATSPWYTGMVMQSPNRNRAVLQLLLWALYSRNVNAYISQDNVDKILASHEIVIGG